MTNKKQLVIGAVDLYSWKDIKVWAHSLRDSGYTGDVVLIGYRIAPDVIPNCEKLDIQVYQVDYDPYGRLIDHNVRGRNTQSHQMRFFHIWQFLSEENRAYDYNTVLMTDVRDVWFQKNPMEYSAFKPSTLFSRQIIASSEGITYEDEFWGKDNLLNGFGPIVYNKMKDEIICNVGVVAGMGEVIMQLCLEIFNLTENRYIPSDQSAYNVLIRLMSQQNKFTVRTHDYSDWACQCGTMLDPTKVHYTPLLKERIPILSNGVVISHHYNRPFHIVHQWDRVPELKKQLEAKYGPT